MRLFIASVSTETNTFSNLPTGLRSFEEGILAHGDATRRPLGFANGPMKLWRELAEAEGWEVVESLCAQAQPGGITVRAVYEGFRDEIVSDLRAAGHVDVILLGLHGAMIADGYDDCEGDLLAHCRAVAPQAVIGGLLDLHCHLSPEMMANATLLVAYKEYPHVDVPERSRELFHLAADAARGRIRPVMRDWNCRMITMMHTPYEPMRSYVDRMSAREGEPGVLSLSLAHGFPWGDCAHEGVRTLAITDGDAALAERLAEELGREIFDLRHEVTRKFPDIGGALDKAVTINTGPGAGPVVLADFSDNAGAGAPSDATFLLEEILNRGLSGVVTGLFWDPVAVRLCREAGEGATLDLRLGGKCGKASGRPLDLRVTVRKLASDVTQKFGDLPVAIGNSAWVSTGDVDIVVNDNRSQVFHPEAFERHGIDLASARIVCVKSSQHFYAGFAPIASEVIHVATPGSIPPDYANIPYVKRTAPYWPRVEDPFA